jgi:hypothetical protein
LRKIVLAGKSVFTDREIKKQRQAARIDFTYELAELSKFEG